MGRPVVTRHPACAGFGWWCYHRRQALAKRWDRAVLRVESEKQRIDREREVSVTVAIVRGHEIHSGKRVY